MPAIVYGLFSEAQAAEAAAAVIVSRSAERPGFPVQSHDKGPLDGNFLPEAATEIGRNTMIAIVAGGVVGLALGAAAGATLNILGLTPGIGAGMGLLTGILSGMLGGMMAGTRQAKAELREAAEQLPPAGKPGTVLLTIEVEDLGHVGTVEAMLDRFGADEIGHC